MENFLGTDVLYIDIVLECWDRADQNRIDTLHEVRGCGLIYKKAEGSNAKRKNEKVSDGRCSRE